MKPIICMAEGQMSTPCKIKVTFRSVRLQDHLLLSPLSPFVRFILFGLPRWIFFLVLTVIGVRFVSIHFKNDVFTHFHTESIWQRNGNNPVSSLKVKVDTPIRVVISGAFRKIEVPVFCSVTVSRCPWWRSLLCNWWFLYDNIIVTDCFNADPSTGPAPD